MTTEAPTRATAGRAPVPRPDEGWFSALVGKWYFWVLAMVLIIVGPLSRALSQRVPPPPSMKIPLPAFQLTNERGQPFGSEDLKGKVWVADFVFTSCPTVCPKLTSRMSDIQHRGRNLGDAFHLVTFTVDPENDTPERLSEYAHAIHANPGQWTFLTGKLDSIESTVVKGFKIAMGKEETSPGSGLFQIFHGERLVLVDGEGNIRGYFEADEVGMGEILRQASILINVH